MKYGKLVRDKIPEIIESKGGTSVIHTATDEEYEKKLKEKLSEEIAEFLKDANPEELADILEVVYALGDMLGITREELEIIRAKKEVERGAFRKKIILDES